MKNVEITLGDAELEIMKVIWAKGNNVSTGDITKAVEGFCWKRTTISTFLSRLVEKGALSCEKKGNLYYYTALISKSDYARLRTKSLVYSLFDGSVKNLAVSLVEDTELSEGDVRELRAIFMGEEK